MRQTNNEKSGLVVPEVRVEKGSYPIKLKVLTHGSGIESEVLARVGNPPPFQKARKVLVLNCCRS
jgi:hypothetical protein